MAGTVQSFKWYFIGEYLRFSINLVHQQVIFFSKIREFFNHYRLNTP
jgi:hypothetical protein